tara:strand:- start:49 stop:642 length:594 start_codon:yes stop_codon:yes gene_type:complete
MINIVKILISGEMCEIKIREHNTLCDELELKSDNGYNNIDFLYEWNYENFFIKIYGWVEGDVKIRNSHNLPTNGNDILHLNIDSEEIALYGDILIIKTDKNNKLYDIYSEDYGEFYNIMYNYNSDYELSSESYDSEDNYNEELYDDNENLNIPNIEQTVLKTTKLKLKSKKTTPNVLGNILNRDKNTYLEYKNDLHL